MRMLCFPISLLLLVAIYSDGLLRCSAAKLPSGFPQCKSEDPKLNDCMRDAITKAFKFMKNGIPSLRLLPIDPLDLDHVDIQESGNRPVNVKLSLNKGKLSGLSDSVFTEANFDTEKRQITGVASLAALILEGECVLDGKILQIPLTGKGNCKLVFGPFQTKFKFSADLETKKGESYWNMKEIILNVFDMKKVHVNFENLFNGDKVLGDATNQALNENWEIFFEELRPALEQTFAEIFRRVGNVVFSRVPENDLFLK